MVLIAAHLNAGRSGGDSVAIGIYTLPLPTPPYPPSPPVSPSVISLMVSVDVKHHVYLLTDYPMTYNYSPWDSHWDTQSVGRGSNSLGTDYSQTKPHPG